MGRAVEAHMASGLHFSKYDIKMTNKHVRKSSASPIKAKTTIVVIPTKTVTKQKAKQTPKGKTSGHRNAEKLLLHAVIES